MTDHIDRAAKIIAQSTPIDEPGYRLRYTVEAARALEEAGLLVTPEHDAAVAAKAWDEGFTRGFYTGTSPLWVEEFDASALDVTNPYEREAGESDGDA